MSDSSLLISYSLLFLRIIIAVIFFSSGKSHVANPVERGKSIEMSPAATTVFGIAEMLGAISIAIGIYTKIGALILMLAMVGAMYKKIFVWKTKFFAEEGYGWHYDLLLLLGLLVILATGGGSYVIFNLL